MTRINTNVSALVARNTLGRSNAALQQSLTRLSTGLRINTGKDDPAGLIASENLRSDITSIKKAIGNTDRANQVIATADSALGQVSSLLNDIRGLVTESANSGALSAEQIAANQLQVDSSLEALNRIAQTTTFQGRRLLDGSLDFITSAGTGFDSVTNLKIDQANLGATGQINVAVDVTAAATKAQISNTGITTAVAGAKATSTLTFADTATASAGSIDIDLAAQQGTGTLAIAHSATTATGTATIALAAKQSTGTLTFDTTGAESVVITALSGGSAAGAVGGASGGIDVVLVQDGTTAGGVNAAATTYNAGSNTITVAADFNSGTLTSAEVQAGIAAIGGGLDFSASGGTAGNLVAADVGSYSNVATGGRNASSEVITLTGIAGAGGNATFNFVEAATGSGGVTAVNNGGGSYTINIDTGATSVTLAQIATAIQGTAEIATAVAANPAAVYFTATDSVPVGTFSATGGSAAFTDNLVVTAKAGGAADGAQATLNGGIDIDFVQNSSTPGGIHAAASSYNASTNVLTIAGDFASGSLTTTEIKAGIEAIGGGADFTVTGGTTSVVGAADATLHANVTTGGRDASTESIAIVGETGAISNFSLNFVEAVGSGAGTGVTVTANGGSSYTINLDTTHSGGINVADIATAILGLNSGAVVNSATYSGTAQYFAGANGDTPPVGAQTITGGLDATADVITVESATETSTANTTTISIVEAASHGAPTAAVVSGNIVVTVDSAAATSISAIASAINNLSDYSATVTDTSGNDVYVNGTDNLVTGTLAGGITPSGGLDSDIVFEIGGQTGSEVVSFGAHSSIAQIVAGVNAVSDATGVVATANGTSLDFTSSGYGSKALVSLNVVSGDTNGTFADALTATRANGTDIEASVNGIQASGDGNSLSINTATLDLSLSLAAGTTTDVNFTITGGGALFQLGPDVVSNQQARLGIGSVNTAKLGGVSGKLFQLGTGGDATIGTDPNVAANIVGEAIDQVTSLRGRLGAFQRTTLETNKQALNDTLVNLTDAESSIRDADFAEESASLTRAQILVQAGTTVLQVANSNPQNVLALLR